MNSPSCGDLFLPPAATSLMTSLGSARSQLRALLFICPEATQFANSKEETMKAAVLIAILLGFSTPAFAKHRHHGHHHRHHHLIANRDRGSHERGIYRCAGCVIRDTLAGVVAVSRENAERFVGVINELVQAGFTGPIHCAASGGHVRNSKHYSGNACDFAQTGWGKTVGLMYTKTASAIIASHGLTNGCSFKDCGHVGTDGDGHGHRYAAVHRRHYAYSRRRHYAEAQ
jgi:hypothetical protein